MLRDADWRGKECRRISSNSRDATLLLSVNIRRFISGGTKAFIQQKEKESRHAEMIRVHSGLMKGRMYRAFNDGRWRTERIPDVQEYKNTMLLCPEILPSVRILFCLYEDREWIPTNIDLVGKQVKQSGPCFCTKTGSCVGISWKFLVQVLKFWWVCSNFQISHDLSTDRRQPGWFILKIIFVRPWYERTRNLQEFGIVWFVWR